MAQTLVTSVVTSRLSGQSGRAVVSARGHHFVVDSPGPLGGPNEEINPIDVLLTALATCGTFVVETAAKEKSIPVDSVTVVVAGDFDPRGIYGEPVDPRLQGFRVRLEIAGPTDAQAKELVEAFQKRCPVYTTLSRSAPIEIETIVVKSNKIGEVKKMKVLRCRDVGFDCDRVIRAASEEEILRQAAEHAQKEHGTEVTSEVAEKIKSLIKEET